MAAADLYVVLDTVQFRKNYFQNRNRLRTEAGWTWVTIPVRRPILVPIAEITVDLDSPLRARYLNLVRHHYRAAPYFDRYAPVVAELVRSSEPLLARLNLRLLDFLFEELGVRTPRVLASELDLPPVSGGSNVNLAICRHVGAQTYLSGPSGPDYLDLETFAADGIDVLVHEFRHPVYEQLHEPFLPGMSVLDLLFNHGPASRDVVCG